MHPTRRDFLEAAISSVRCSAAGLDFWRVCNPFRLRRRSCRLRFCNGMMGLRRRSG